jgi:hypothetical protein
MLDVFQAIYGEPIEKGGKIKIPLSSKQYLLLKGTPFAVYQHLQSGKAEDSFYTK